MLNLATLLRESASRDPSHTAIVVGDTKLSYAELNGTAARFGGALKSLGVEQGTHVALMLPNVPQFTVAYYGTHYAGGVVVPLNVLLTTDEVAYHLEDSDAEVIVVWEGFLEAAEAAFRKTPSCKHLIIARADQTDTSAPSECHNLGALLGSSEPITDLAGTMPDDTAVILYTSGTTGRPKGAELTQFNMFFNALYSQRFLMDLNQETVALACLPLFHSFGQTVIQNAVLAAGGTVVLLPRFTREAALSLMQSHGVNLFAGVPTMYFALLNYPKADSFKLALKYCLSGGASMPVEVMHAFDKKYGVNILEGYGLSETSPVASFNQLDRPKKPGSIGHPIWGVEMKLVDEDDRTITEPGVPGEICIKGHNIMKGYYKKPEATAETMKGGWFHSGDIGQRDDEGYYFIVDRKKDMIIRGGFNVYPREVEEVLYAHPSIAEAAVIGVPHESHGEEVKACVVFKTDQLVTIEELTAHCKEKLAAYKYPRIIEVMSELPHGPTGKILKKELR